MDDFKHWCRVRSYVVAPHNSLTPYLARMLTRWLNTGLRLQHHDPEFRDRIDSLDHQIASADSNNTAMRYVAP